MRNLFDETNEIIRALWWNQPYAQLMVHGKIETRTRHTNVRGKVLICSCKKEYPHQKVIEISGEQTGRINRTLQVHHSCLPMGQAIAIGNLAGCRRMTRADEDRCFVEYRPELWCWIFEEVQPIELFEIKGKQGWAILDAETKSKIKIIT